jgi:hypothetical protein
MVAVKAFVSICDIIVPRVWKMRWDEELLKTKLNQDVRLGNLYMDTYNHRVGIVDTC